MAASRVIIAFAASLPAALALVQPRRLESCAFANEPETPYFWDPSCPDNGQSLGCMADGVNAQCRFCGAGDYEEVLCPGTWCDFDNVPHAPYYWDGSCAMGKVGCLADGKHAQCRYCGDFPYNGTVPCPAGAVTPPDHCQFENEPEIAFFWDATCSDGMLGCRADGQHVGCRFCGSGIYSDVTCPASLCTFAENGLQQPAHPHRFYWEPQCWGTEAHILGCLADGVHPQCRYCGGGDYASIPCP